MKLKPRNPYAKELREDRKYQMKVVRSKRFYTRKVKHKTHQNDYFDET